MTERTKARNTDESIVVPQTRSLFHHLTIYLRYFFLPSFLPPVARAPVGGWVGENGESLRAHAGGSGRARLAYEEIGAERAEGDGEDEGEECQLKIDVHRFFMTLHNFSTSTSTSFDS